MNSRHQELHDLAHTLVNEMSKIIKDKLSFLQLLVLSFLVRGHVLIEDFPGVGKTTAVKALSRLIKEASQGRIQCTPDLLPYDITGVEIYDSKSAAFHFAPGPVFHDIVLVDEINRATPKTQSALLEAMAERQITVSGKTYHLPDLFWVAATQNPLEQNSTYPLPAAELDRFLLKLTPGYPSFETECQITREDPAVTLLPKLQAVTDKQILLKSQTCIDEIFCDEKHVKLAVRVAEFTRNHPQVAMGVSPRGPIGLLKLAKAHALFSAREFVTDEDILPLIPSVYGHRIIPQEPRLNIISLLQEAAASACEEFYQ